MKWIAIAGSWKDSVPNIETDVRTTVRQMVERGDGLVTGGALGVDYIATDEYRKSNPLITRLKIFLPSTLERYRAHYKKRAEEGVITSEQAEMLISQLTEIHQINPTVIVENEHTVIIDKTSYFERITKIIDASDELVAFQINKSEGTQDTINKAIKKGIPHNIFSYTVSNEGI